MTKPIGKMNIAEFAEFIINGIVEQSKLQGYVPVSPIEVRASKLVITSENENAEFRFVTFNCVSLTGGKEKYLAVLLAEQATELAASLLKAVAKIKEELEEEGE